MKSNFILLIAIFIAFYSCKYSNINHNESKRKDDIIKLNPCKYEENKILLSDIADDIKYVTLDKSFPIASIRSLKLTEKSIYIKTGHNNPVIVKYKRQGIDPVQIGKIGKGPGEFLYCKHFAIEPETENIYMFAGNNDIHIIIMVYDNKGNYIREFKLFEGIPTYGLNEMEFFNNSYLFFSQNAIGANALYNWIIVDTLGNIVSSKRNYTTPFKIRSGSPGGIYKYKNKISYWVDYNDTIFTISSDFNYRATYMFAPGKHRLPKKDLKFINPIQILEAPFQYYCSKLILETNRFLINEYVYKMRCGLAIIDKKSGKSYTTHSKLKRLKCSVGIINDLDGGEKLIPKCYYTEKKHEYLVGIVYPYQLIEQVASAAFKSSTPKYPEKKKELEKLANSLKEDDNPVLMLVRLKE